MYNMTRGTVLTRRQVIDVISHYLVFTWVKH